MQKQLPALVIGTMLLLSLGGSVFLGLEHRQLQHRHEDVVMSKDRLQDKARQLQKKYSEQKSRTAWLEKARQDLQREKGELEATLKTVKDKYSELQGDASVQVQRLQKKLSQKDRECQAKLTELAEKYNDAVSKNKQATAFIEEQKKKLEALQQAKAELQDQLSAKRETLKRFRNHNAKLSQIAEELIDKYKNKSVSDVLAQSEPLTKVKQVELEHMVQEYMEKIDEQVISEKES